MAFENISDSIIKVETLIGDSDPNKGIPVDSSKFKFLQLETNLFSIAPICLLRYEFTHEDDKPKVYDNIYIRIYKNLDRDDQGATILNASLTILSANLVTFPSNDGIIERYDYICVSSSIYTLTNKMNIAFKDTKGIDVISEILALKDNLSYQLTVDSEMDSSDKMNWIFSQKTSLDIIKKTLRHMSVQPHDKDIPILFSNADRSAKLTTLKTLCLKNPKCTIIDTKSYDNIDDDDKKSYLKFADKVISKYQGAIPLLTNGYGQMLYQYNPWADQDFGPGIVGMILRTAQFISDIIVEELKPLETAFRHPDKSDDECVYRAYESYNFSMGTMMQGTPIKPPNTNSNISTLKYVGINTKDLHYTYNVAPFIYENIVRNFFANSIDVICYTNGQNERFANFSEFPKLGDCVELSLNSPNEEIEDNRNGKYLVGKYTIQFGGNTSIPVVKYSLFRDTLNTEKPKEEGEE